MNIFYQPLIPQGVLHLDEDESRHCVKVLRKKKGDMLRLTDGAGSFYDAVITAENPKACMFEITAQTPQARRSYTIHVAISPTKNADRIEWFTEKTVELGIDAITLMECENTERTHSKTERLTKVAISAMKQSVKATLPRIEGLTAFKDVVARSSARGRYIAFVDNSNPLHLLKAARGNEDYLVLIGPEGDFSRGELALAMEMKFEKVSLGPNRLRTETAGLAACHILNLINT